MSEIAVWEDQGLPPKVLAGTYRRTGRNAVQSTPMEAGIVKTRRKTLMASQPVQASIIVDHAGLARFWRFFDDTTNGGADPFLMRNQVFDGLAITRRNGSPITKRNGSPILRRSWWPVIFTPGSPPQEGDNNGVWFTVGFSLTILP